MTMNSNTMSLNALNKIKKKCPKIFVKDVYKELEFMPSKNDKDSSDKEDLYLLDIQMCISHIFCKQMYLVWPRWCDIVKPDNFSSVNLIVFDELSTNVWSECLIKYGQSKKFRKYYDLLMEKLNISIKFINPKLYGFSWKSELLEIPKDFVSRKDIYFESKADGSDKLKRKRTFDGQLKTSLPKEATLKLNGKNGLKLPVEKPKDAFSRTKLLLNIQQMRCEKMPIDDGSSHYERFKYSKPFGYTSVSDNSPMFAIDCEMVECYDGEINRCVPKLAQVSIVDEYKETLYNTYVKPEYRITKYLTEFSGITKKIMMATKKNIRDVQREIAEILPSDAILVGHSIANDLNALEIFHPYIIDTSIIYNLRGSRYAKSKLKDLTFHFLNREIQNKGKLGHDALEDSIATMDLVLLKLSKSLGFGDLARIVDSDDSDNDENDQSEQQAEPISESLRSNNDNDNRDKKDQCEPQQQPQAEQPAEPISEPISFSNQPQTNYPTFPIFTDNEDHLNHRKFLWSRYRKERTVSILKFTESSRIKTVAQVNGDKSQFSEVWFPQPESTTTQDSSTETNNVLEKTGVKTDSKRTHKTHHLNISEVSFRDLSSEQLPGKNWMARLLKKIVKEFDKLPPNALCGLLIVDAPYRSDWESSEYGMAYFGITPWNHGSQNVDKGTTEGDKTALD